MLGAERDRLAEAEAVGVERTAFARSALGLVGDDDDRGRFRPKPAPDFFVEQCQSLARVDHEQDRVGVAHRGFGLLPHPPGQRVRILILETGRVDHPEFEAMQLESLPDRARLAAR